MGGKIKQSFEPKSSSLYEKAYLRNEANKISPIAPMTPVSPAFVSSFYIEKEKPKLGDFIEKPIKENANANGTKFTLPETQQEEQLLQFNPAVLSSKNLQYNPNLNQEVVSQEQVDAIMNKQYEESGLSKWGRALQKIGAGFASMDVSEQGRDKARLLLSQANEVEQNHMARKKEFYQAKLEQVKQLREAVAERNKAIDYQNDMLYRQYQVARANEDARIRTAIETENNRIANERLKISDKKAQGDLIAEANAWGLNYKNPYVAKQAVNMIKDLMTNPDKANALDLDVYGMSGLPDIQQVVAYVKKTFGGMEQRDIVNEANSGGTAQASTKTTLRTPTPEEADAYSQQVKRAKEGNERAKAWVADYQKTYSDYLAQQKKKVK